MDISHIISFIDVAFIKSNLYFIAVKLRSFVCQSQVHVKSNNASRLKTQEENLMTNSEDTDNYGDHTKEPFRRRLLLF